MIRVILTDIEGTTSSISFVHEVLFPYAKEQLPAFLRAHAEQPKVRVLLDEVASIEQRTLDTEQALTVLLDWIAQDKKIAPLKALQGMIWEAGYRNRDYFGHLYPDAYEYLQTWHAQGLKLFVFSSGSVFAQKLLFEHTDYGDLTPLFSGYFDTRVGAKQQSESYRQISQQMEFSPSEVLFLSDVAAELDAAAEAGMAVCQLVRPGTMACDRHPNASDFSEVHLDVQD